MTLNLQTLTSLVLGALLVFWVFEGFRAVIVGLKKHGPSRGLVRDPAFRNDILPAALILCLYPFYRLVGGPTEVIYPSSVEPSGVRRLVFVSRLGYRVMRPPRGAFVELCTEAEAGLAADWRRSVPPRFHLREEILGRPSRRWYETVVGRSALRRIVGMPGERASIVGSRVTIDGTPLVEPYARGASGHGPRLEFQLGDDEFLAARDWRDDATLALPGSYVVVHGRQIVGRELFVLWPFDSIGPDRIPPYNVANPPSWRIPLSDAWLRRLGEM